MVNYKTHVHDIDSTNFTTRVLYISPYPGASQAAAPDDTVSVHSQDLEILASHEFLDERSDVELLSPAALPRTQALKQRLEQLGRTLETRTQLDTRQFEVGPPNMSHALGQTDILEIYVYYICV